MTKLHPQLGFTFITSLDVVLFMVGFHWETRTFVPCVNKNLHQINLQKYTPEKNSLWCRHPYLIFIQVSTYQPSINWPFIYHMYAYLVQITVVNCDAQPSNDVKYFKMFYVAVIMQEGLVASFANQIWSEYYGGNRYMSIEGIALEHFSAAPQVDINSSTISLPLKQTQQSKLKGSVRVNINI